MDWKREPVRIRQLILAVIALAVSFGVSITDAQIDHIDAVITAIIAIIVGESIRQNVSPVDKDGNVIK